MIEQIQGLPSFSLPSSFPMSVSNKRVAPTGIRPQSDPSPSLLGRELMDLDLDLDSWTFDPIALVSNSSSSSPFPPFPNPSSPLWFFEDGVADAWNCIPEFPRGNSEATNGNINKDDGNMSRPQASATEDNSGDYSLIRERMTQALRHFKESTDQHVLVQVWAPVKNGDRYVLTTSGQPFFLDPQSLGLHQYRTVSMMYMFSVNGDSDGDLGLPGRVFRQKTPEWTPDVQYYSSKEYPRLNHAVHYNVRGTLALPVFEPSKQSCVGVVELIMTSTKINYAPEVDKVCKALEAVNLKSYDILGHPSAQIINEGRQTALAEILEILTTVCEAHKLPLAQTWVPCRHRSVLAYGGGSKKKCSSFDGNCMGQVCMSTSDVAVYVIDAHMWRFRDACLEHHLQKGQGVAGRAFASRGSCFSRDITQFCKTDYPLVHYARLFGLAGCLALCLQSTQTGSDDYILEFFLPPDCKDTGEQQALLDSMTTLIKQCFRSLKMMDDVEPQEGKSLEIIDVPVNENHELEPKCICGQRCSGHSCTKSNESNANKVTDYSKDEDAVLDLPTDADAEKNCNKLIVDVNGSGTPTPLVASTSERKLERKRGKAEKSISLEVLQQYFSGSLKDAARILGVCPTTMKRICRQHGISRWPSRKINKVNRSLSKLKTVIESVQGAEGAFNLPSLACQLPVAVSLNAYQQSGGTKALNLQCSEEEKDFSPQKTPGDDDDHYAKLKTQEEAGSHPEHGKDSHPFKARSSSGEGSIDSPTSQESCEDVNPISSFNLGQGLDFSGSLGLNSSIPDAIIVESQNLLGGILIEDSGSSKDLINLLNSVTEACEDEHAVATITNVPSRPAAMKDLKTVTIKASYREDIIRFRLPCGAGVIELNDEVARRLKLEVGMFDIKYLDDDQEWVILSCDADLEECMEIARLSGVHVIRLSVHDIVSFLGSSCGSS